MEHKTELSPLTSPATWREAFLVLPALAGHYFDAVKSLPSGLRFVVLLVLTLLPVAYFYFHS